MLFYSHDTSSAASLFASYFYHIDHKNDNSDEERQQRGGRRIPGHHMKRINTELNQSLTKSSLMMCISSVHESSDVCFLFLSEK